MYKKEIQYKDIIFRTNLYRDLSDEEYNHILSCHHDKPPIGSVLEQLQAIHNGGNNLSAVNRYYFFDLMCDVKTKKHRLTVNEFIQSRELCGHAVAKMEHSKMSKGHDDIYELLDTLMRLGTGSKLAQRPSNFKIKTADDVIRKYCFNGNYYDYSCGWGVRLLSALRNGVNYYGTDPNPYLYERLNTLYNDYKNVNVTCAEADIRCQGSEVHIPEYDNKMSLCFSSPPYYNLEDYRYGDQSYKEGVTYEQWLENFLYPTLSNCKEYLVDGGFLGINIKNKDEYKMLTDSINFIQDTLGMQYIDDILLKNGARLYNERREIDNNEHCLIFKKQ